MATDKKPLLTKSLAMRLDGEGYTAATDNILADGQPTGVVLHSETDGRPHYRYTVRELRKGDETYDLMAEGATQEGAEAWIIARLPEPAPEPAAEAEEEAK